MSMSVRRFARNPIYATLHESSYADGFATRWSASRLLPAEIAAEGCSPANTSFRGCSRTTAGSRPHREAAEILAEHEWPRQFDAAQLGINEVPVGGHDLCQ